MQEIIEVEQVPQPLNDVDDSANEDDRQELSDDREDDKYELNDVPQRRKKRKPRKKKKIDEDPPTDYECDWRAKAKDSKIFDDPNLPIEIKQRYAQLEFNPYVMIVSQLPKQIILKGLEEYFNTLISNLNPKLPERRPVKSLEFGVLRSWVVLELSSREAKQTVAPLDILEYIGCKIKIEKPKKFLDRILNASTEVYEYYFHNDQMMNQGDIQKHESIRLYLGGLPLFLNEDDVRKLVSTFGPLSYFNLVKDNSNQQ